MRLFTNGVTTVLRTEQGLVTWPHGREPTFDSGEELADTIDPTNDYSTNGLLLRGPTSGRDLSKAIDTEGLVDADVIGDSRVALLYKDQTLRWGDPKVPDSLHTMDLASFQAKSPPWAKSMELQGRSSGAGFERGSVLANRYGIGVASFATGNVVLVKPDSAEIACSFRLNVACEAMIYARPTKTGLLVTIVYNGRETLVLRVSESGELMASGPSSDHGEPPALEVGARSIVVDDTVAYLLDENQSRLTNVNLELGFSPVCCAASADSRYAAFANDATIVLAELVENDLSEVDRLEHADARRAQKRHKENDDALRSYYPKRAAGDPTIGFAAKPIVSPPWEAAVGEFAIDLVVRSAGGPGRGITVELSGDALKKATLSAIEFDGRVVPLEDNATSLRAVMPDIELATGILLPFEPKPKGELQVQIANADLEVTHFTLRLHGRAEEPSGDLLCLEVAPADSEGPPLKWMRPLTIR